MTRRAPVPWRALGVLLVVNAALGGVLFTELRRGSSAVLPVPSPAPPGVPAPTGTAQDAADAVPDLAPLDAYATVAERPLFLPGRRPFAAAKAAPPPPPPAPGGVPALKGIFVTAERAVALFQLPDVAQYIVGERGSTVGSWTVEDIGPGRVKLRRGATGRVLLLEGGGAQGPDTR